MANTYGTPNTAQLMADIGSAVFMNYGCSGSGAYIPDAVNALHGYGYTSATVVSMPHVSLKTNIDNGRPVLMTGCS